MADTLLHNATVYAEDGVYEDGWVLVQGKRIAQVGQGALPSLARRRAHRSAADRRWLPA